MKIWFDILTPKQLVFFEPMVKRLRRRRHRVLCTSRSYREVSALARARRFSMESVGRHGGGTRLGKLRASAARLGPLARITAAFNPDLTVSFCSPDAALVSHGLGTDHIAFIDAPHSYSPLRLSAPLVQKILVPWIIPKGMISRHGMAARNVVQYRSIDGAMTALRRPAPPAAPLAVDPSKKTILIRPTETQAAYTDGGDVADAVIKAVVSGFASENILILSRYAGQTEGIKSRFGRDVTVIGMTYDGRYLLDRCDVFVGSGGTMTAEAALMGVPTISYNGVPNIIEEYLVKRRLAAREETARGIKSRIALLLSPGAGGRAARGAVAERARAEMSAMEDPFDCLTRVSSGMGRPLL